MMVLTVVLLILTALLLLGIVYLLVAGSGSWKRRAAALEALAPTLGLTFASEQPSAAELLTSGGPGRTNLMTGALEGATVEVFDVFQPVGSGVRASGYFETVAMVKSPELRLPVFEAVPSSLLARLRGGRLQAPEIGLPAHPKFARGFELRSEEPEAIRGLFSPSVVAFFESRPGVKVEGQGTGFVLGFPGKTREPAEIRSLVGDALELARRLRAAPRGAG